MTIEEESNNHEDETDRNKNDNTGDGDGGDNNVDVDDDPNAVKESQIRKMTRLATEYHAVNLSQGTYKYVRTRIHN